MKKLIPILLTLLLCGCYNKSYREYEIRTYKFLDSNFLDTQPPDTYTYKHLKTIERDDKIVVIIKMTVSTIHGYPYDLERVSQSWEQEFVYDKGE